MDINKVIFGIKDLNNNLEEYKRVLLSVDSKHLSNVFGNDITKLENYKNTISGLMGLINIFIPTMKNALSSLGNDKSIENMTKQINECKVAFDFLKESEHVLKTIKGISPNSSQILNESKNYVKNQEILSGKRFEFNGKSGNPAEIEYYNQQLNKLVRGTQEYITVLELRRQAEQRVSNEAKQSADQQVKAQQQAIDNMRNKMLSIASTISSVGKAINNTINQIIGAIRKILSVIKTVFNGAISIVVGFKNTVARIIELFGNLGNRVRSTFQSLFGGASKANGSLNLLKGTATELKSKIDLLKMAFNTLFNNTYMKSAETLYQSIYSLKNIVGEELTQNTIDWANSMENAFGISARGLISDLNELSGVLYGLGMKAEDVAIGSQNILMTSRYLAFMGAAGGQVEVVMSKLNSGMKGMTQAIDDLGLSVREAQMDSYLRSLKAMGGEYANIGTSFASLNEEARVYVRYASLMQQLTSKYDLTNFADALTTTTGRISVLRESIKSLKTVVGQGFIEAFGKIAGYITYIVRFIEKQVIKLAGLFNIDLNISKDTNKAENTIGNVNNSLGDTKDKIEDIEKAAKKASKSTLGFDKITQLGSNSSDSDKASGNDFDYSKLFSSGLDGLNAYAEAQENYMNNLESEFKTMLSNISKAFNTWAKEITGREDFNLGFDSTKFKADLDNLWAYTNSSLSKMGKTFAYYGLSFLDDFDIGSKVNGIVEILSKLAELVDTILTASEKGLKLFYDNSIKPIAEALGISTDTLIENILIKLDELIKWFNGNEPEVTKWFEGLSEGFNIEVENIQKKIPELMSAITGKKDNLDFVVTNATTTGTWNDILNIVNSISRVMQTLWKDIVSPLLSDLGTWGKDEFLPWLNEELGRFADWLDSHAEQIKDILAEIGRFAWEGFKAFVDVVGKLVNYAVENPEAVVNIFKGLIGLKIGSWAMNQVGGITTLLANMALLKGGGLTGLLGGAGATAGASAGAGATAGATGAGVAGLGVSAGAIAGIVAGIAILVASFVDLWNTADWFRESFEALWESIKTTFNNAIEPIKDAFGNLKNTWDDFYKTYENSGAKEVIGGLFVALGYIITGAVNIIIGVLGSLITFITNSLADLLEMISGIINIVSGVIQTIIGLFKGIITGDWSWFKDGLSKILAGITELLSGILKGLADLVGGALNIVLDIINAVTLGLVQGIKDKTNEVIQGFKDFFGNIVKAVKEFLGIHSPSTVFADIGSFLVQGLSQGINNAWSGFKDGVLKLFGGIKDNIIDIFSKAKDGAIGAWSNAKDLFSGIASNISSAFNGITKSIGDIFTKAKNKGVEILGELGIDVRTSGSTQSSYKPSSRMASVQSSASIAKFAGFRANGGAIPNGSVIVGNEGGNLEMYGKMAGGMSVAANNNMITTAIYKAVRQAVADGTPKNIEKQSGGTIINTPFLIADESSLRQLKRMLAEI